MSLSCPECGASMPDTAEFCPGCGRAMRPVQRVQGKVGALPEAIAGAVAYFTIIPAIIFLLVEPYNKNRFLRFHSFQCLGLWLAALVTGTVLKLAGFVLFFVPLMGPLLVVLLSIVFGLGYFVIWLVLVIKALQGERFKLPIIGKFADQQADSV
ncbi:MAG: zinc-ribbon domain-containing protein [Candidatus Sulfotelmatobacter sp.]